MAPWTQDSELPLLSFIGIARHSTARIAGREERWQTNYSNNITEGTVGAEVST